MGMYLQKRLLQCTLVCLLLLLLNLNSLDRLPLPLLYTNEACLRTKLLQFALLYPRLLRHASHQAMTFATDLCLEQMPSLIEADSRLDPRAVAMMYRWLYRPAEESLSG